MAGTVLKSVFKKPYTVKYPFGKLIERPNARGKIAIDIKQCIFCGICQKKCPTKAIRIVREEKNWSIDRLRCITCGHCVESCPKKSIIMESSYPEPLSSHKEEVYKDA
jgi:formate hydrogenlyase subunit 6/NADH:ubiquinone oxidoreductase subunit I